MYFSKIVYIINHASQSLHLVDTLMIHMDAGIMIIWALVRYATEPDTSISSNSNSR